eukprot:3952781-Pleurochrysis_carterae.AAC.2
MVQARHAAGHADSTCAIMSCTLLSWSARHGHASIEVPVKTTYPVGWWAMPEAPHEAAARSRAGTARTRLVRDAVGCDEPGQVTESSSDDEISVEQAMLTSAVVCSENNASIDQRDPSVSAKSHARSTPRSHSTLFKQSTASSTSAAVHSASSLPAEEDYNSADEHEMALSGADSEERERSFEALCAQRGLQIKQMFRDGNCMFRCVADR